MMKFFKLNADNINPSMKVQSDVSRTSKDYTIGNQEDLELDLRNFERF